MYTNIFPEEIENWRDLGARVIDVREGWEYRRGCLPGAENIPLGELESRSDSLGGPIVLVCASGKRSERAAIYLASVGLYEVANLVGGVIGWTERGHPLDRRMAG